jgi:hypothetical protein
MQRLEGAALMCALVNIPLATAWRLMRVDVGCVLIRFGSRQGVHESALVAIALGGPLRTILRPGWCDRAPTTRARTQMTVSPAPSRHSRCAEQQHRWPMVDHVVAG